VIKAITYNEELLRKRVVEIAKKQLYKPYIYEKGHSEIKHGPNSYDCAGLIWYIYHEFVK
jgi:cell wall-associated NlpC family hydrolase